MSDGPHVDRMLSRDLVRRGGKPSRSSCATMSARPCFDRRIGCSARGWDSKLCAEAPGGSNMQPASAANRHTPRAPRGLCRSTPAPRSALNGKEWSKAAHHSTFAVDRRRCHALRASFSRIVTGDSCPPGGLVGKSSAAGPAASDSACRSLVCTPSTKTVTCRRNCPVRHPRRAALAAVARSKPSRASRNGPLAPRRSDTPRRARS